MAWFPRGYNVPIAFAVPGVPVAQARPRAFNAKFGIRMYMPKKSADYRELVIMHATRAMHGREPMEGPLDMVCVFSFPLHRKQTDITHIVRPDVDNLLKGIADGCKGICYRDDSQITVMTGVKVRSHEEPCALVSIGYAAIK